MSIQEQTELKTKAYNNAIRYMDNAKETLKLAQKRDNFYHDTKYVQTACGTAYNGVLIALNCYVELNPIPDNNRPLKKGKVKGKVKKEGRKSIDFYRMHLKDNQKMMDLLNSVYEILHLLGYYDGISNAKIVHEGFEDAYALIDKIKP